MLAYGMLLVTRCRLISINSSLVRSLLAACWSVIAAYCSSLATRLIVPLASRSSTYAAPGILLLIACYTLPSRQLFSLKILLTRRSPHDVCSTLLPLCYWQLATHCYLFAVCSPITTWLLLLAGCTAPFSLLAPRRSLHVGSTLTSCHRLLQSGSSRLTARFFCFRLVVDKTSCPPRSLFLAVCCVLPTSTNPLILVAHCRLRAIFSTPLVLDVHSS